MIDQLLSAARAGVESRRSRVPQSELAARLEVGVRPRPFNEALAQPGLSIIAEYKRRSPSAGPISAPELAAQVRAYERGGATALSVLTEESHFDGSLADLEQARGATSLPILRKDFVVDPYQLYEAAASGADAVLLIVRALDDETLARLIGVAAELDLDCLVEVHDAAELERVLEHGIEVIGINNRDLDSGEVDVSTTFELLPDVPAGKTVVTESGISDPAQLEELRGIGVDAALIGEHLMRAPEPERELRRLAGADEPTREHNLP